MASGLFTKVPMQIPEVTETTPRTYKPGAVWGAAVASCGCAACRIAVISHRKRKKRIGYSI